MSNDQQKREAAEARAAAAQGRTDQYVAALQAERVGYERRGLDDRVAQVDAEIARVAGAPKRGRKPAQESADS